MTRQQDSSDWHLERLEAAINALNGDLMAATATVGPTMSSWIEITRDAGLVEIADKISDLQDAIHLMHEDRIHDYMLDLSRMTADQAPNLKGKAGDKLRELSENLADAASMIRHGRAGWGEGGTDMAAPKAKAAKTTASSSGKPAASAAKTKKEPPAATKAKTASAAKASETKAKAASGTKAAAAKPTAASGSKSGAAKARTSTGATAKAKPKAASSTKTK